LKSKTPPYNTTDSGEFFQTQALVRLDSSNFQKKAYHRDLRDTTRWLLPASSCSRTIPSLVRLISNPPGIRPTQVPNAILLLLKNKLVFTHRRGMERSLLSKSSLFEKKNIYCKEGELSLLSFAQFQIKLLKVSKDFLKNRFRLERR
jgi:hypothetical protein